MSLQSPWIIEALRVVHSAAISTSLLIASLSFLSAHAADEPVLRDGVVGFEFSVSFRDRERRTIHFGKSAWEFREQRKALFDQIERRLKKTCKTTPDCRTLNRLSHTRVELIMKDGFRVKFDTDPGVLEITTTKFPYSDFEKRSSFLQNAIFDELSELDLFPLQSLGGGHVNLDVFTHFGWNVHGLLDFMEDLIREEAVFGHAFREPSCKIACTAGQLSDSAYADLREILLSARNFADSSDQKTLRKGLQELAQKLASWQSRHEFGTFFFKLEEESGDMNYRFEFRSPKPQADVLEGRTLVDLLHLRILHLRKNPPAQKGLPLVKPAPPGELETVASRLNQVVTEAGGSPLSFTSALRRDLRTLVLEKLCPELLRPATGTRAALPGPTP